MATQVETFECTETAAEPIEASEEAIGIIETLGLEGQKELVATKPSGHAGRVPYREITDEEFAVYSILCPNQSPIERYDSAPIPLRVLQVAAHAKQCLPKSKLIVMDRESVTVHDPVLIAEVPDPAASWRSKRFILARWGDVLESFPVLLKRAAVVQREKLTALAAKAVNEVAAAADQAIVFTANLRFEGNPNKGLSLA